MNAMREDADQSSDPTAARCPHCASTTGTSMKIVRKQTVA
jgi:hypothetical protein